MEQQVALREAMRSRGHPAGEEHPWDQEKGPEGERVMLWFQLPKDAEGLHQTALAALEGLQGGGHETVYLRAWRDDAGTVTPGGISYRRHEDLLGGVLGA